MKVSQLAPVMMQQYKVSGMPFLTQAEIKATFGKKFKKEVLTAADFEGCDGLEELLYLPNGSMVVRRTFKDAPQLSCYAMHAPNSFMHREYLSRFNLMPGSGLVIRQKWTSDKWTDMDPVV